jgi:ABC-type hemin transport system substrate-binding protein
LSRTRHKSSETVSTDRRARTIGNALAVVAKILAAKGKGDALVTLFREQLAAVRKVTSAGPWSTSY